MHNRSFSISACSILLTACATIPPGPPAQPVPVEIQILGLNDFHGNLETPSAPISIIMADGTKLDTRVGGAAQLTTTLRSLRTGRSVTVSAGDMIGASPLVSAYFLDEPTIQAMNAAGVDIAAVGNHEFDKGSAELLRMAKGGCDKHTTRVPCRLEPFGGASFEFLAANVRTASGATLFPATAIRRFGPVTIGFIGMTLKETQTLVTPAGVAGLSFTDEAATANALVHGLKAAGADTVVLVIHEGGRTKEVYRESGCDGLSGPILDIADKLDPAIRTIVSGHTHNAYACEIDRGGAKRMLTGAGRYGYFVSDVRLTFDPAGRTLVGQRAINVPVLGERFAAEPGVDRLVKRYVTAAAPAAARVVGRLSGPAAVSEVDDESPAANLIADAQLAATRAPNRGGAQVSLINATGVRTDLVPNARGEITYGQIFAMQPFGNNLVVKTLTGAQLKAVLEQQFGVRDGVARVKSLLAPSAGFRFGYDLDQPEGQRILWMTLDGKPIDPTARYRVTVNNFLSSGGDGFSALTQGTDTFDAGLDLDALEAWLAKGQAVPPTGRTVGKFR
ncbi:MAG TPA: bifunctional metallophosphatase/5'-nucleotidase [Sphingomicrobium sp.]|nr:bifunctional metallophosphatase/5'-nucleotidase [Sphingomicrobium sp.]